MNVGGVARRALTLSVADLRSQFPAHLLHDTVSCVGNAPGGSLLSSSLFRGARLADVMEAAGVSSSATGAAVLALDGFVATQDIEDLRKRPCLLAYEMGTSEADLRPLPIENGFPIRLLTPGLYGYKQPKWIDSITFLDQDGYDTALARSVKYAGGKMQLSSGFSVPRGGQLTAGTHDFFGYAFGDGRRIAKVDVKVDDGPWEAAEIVWNDGDDGKPAHVWCLFRYRWVASSPGIHRLTARATYEDGEVQKSGREFPYSGGSLAPIELKVVGAS
jgi:DMSO/TMAO reductase YedYZ molybdopterin-dependent catalytic subunit